MEADIGYAWLAETYQLSPVQPFPTISRIGKSRTTRIQDGRTEETYLESARPEASLAGHLAFALRREGVHLEFLSRLFLVTPAAAMEEWVKAEPSGQYARRAGFLYEWLTGRHLDFGGASGNYIPALPEEEFLTATEPENISRWRVRNNLPGTPEYCPLVRRTPKVRAYENYNLADELEKLEVEFSPEILMRSAVWLTLKESRASFQIEREAGQTDRVQRLAKAMELWTGTVEDPLSESFLRQLQGDILGERALRSGLRGSPVFVGEARLGGEVVHYIAPSWESINPMLGGLSSFAAKTVGKAAILRAAVLSFGFVYIHPMADGNGRISRFLINDTLRRSGAVTAPMILPISSTITHSVKNRSAYDHALENFSKPFMGRFRGSYTFGTEVEYEDGIKSNFHFSGYEEARAAWAYPDLTAQVEYLGGVIAETVEAEMRDEARFLAELLETRRRVKEIIEGPDADIDRIIRSVRDNRSVSGKLSKEFPLLEDPLIADGVILAVMGGTPENQS